MGYMEMRTLILSTIKKQGQVTTADLVGLTGLSRAYAQRFLKNLADEGVIVLMGKANQAHYIHPSKKGAGNAKPLSVRRIMTNKDLAEDKVLHEIKEKSAIFQGIAGNVSSTLDYAFTEMLNNAIEHSTSEKIDVVVMRTATDIRFMVADRGIGIFNNCLLYTSDAADE